jgi:hypothetical protein
MEITQEMIRECVSDLSLNGKYYKLFEMLTNEVDSQISDKQLNSMLETLKFVGIECSGKSKLEILYEYSKLI